MAQLPSYTVSTFTSQWKLALGVAVTAGQVITQQAALTF
jgi:hypothetical protein